MKNKSFVGLEAIQCHWGHCFHWEWERKGISIWGGPYSSTSKKLSMPPNCFREEANCKERKSVLVPCNPEQKWDLSSVQELSCLTTMDLARNILREKYIFINLKPCCFLDPSWTHNYVSVGLRIGVLVSWDLEGKLCMLYIYVCFMYNFTLGAPQAISGYLVAEDLALLSYVFSLWG